MGALSSKIGSYADRLGWESTDINGEPRTVFARVVDPIGACIQPAAFTLYDVPIPEPAIENETVAEPPTLNDAPHAPFAQVVPPEAI